MSGDSTVYIFYTVYIILDLFSYTTLSHQSTRIFLGPRLNKKKEDCPYTNSNLHRYRIVTCTESFLSHSITSFSLSQIYFLILRRAMRGYILFLGNACVYILVFFSFETPYLLAPALSRRMVHFERQLNVWAIGEVAQIYFQIKKPRERFTE